MKKILISLFAVLAAVPAFAAYDVSVSPYLSLDGGFTSTSVEVIDGYDVDDSTQWFYGASLGVAFAERWRAELSYQGREKLKASETLGGLEASGDISTHSVMANAFYDLYSAERFKIFVGAGLGASFWKGEIRLSAPGISLSDSSSETNPVAALYAGITLRSAENENLFMDVGLAYYHFFMKSGDTAISRDDIDNIAPKVSIRYLF